MKASFLLKFHRAIEPTNHACDRFAEKTGVEVSKQQLLTFVMSAERIMNETLLAKGYRVQFGRRKNQGMYSWYFEDEVNGNEVVYVLERVENDDVVITTVLGRDKQSDMLRCV